MDRLQVTPFDGTLDQWRERALQLEAEVGKAPVTSERGRSFSRCDSIHVTRNVPRLAPSSPTATCGQCSSHVPVQVEILGLVLQKSSFGPRDGGPLYSVRGSANEAPLSSDVTYCTSLLVGWE